MNKNIITFLLFLSPVFSFAQDFIYKKDRTKAEGKVLEVGVDNVKYKLASNPDGPVYVIPKSEIATIVFQNGTFEVFASQKRSAKTYDSLPADFCRNQLGIDAAQFLFTSVGIVYEHVFGEQGFVAVRIPLSFGLENSGEYDNNYLYGKTFGTGLDLKFFPGGQGTFKYFFAPYIEFGRYRYRYDQNTYYYYSSINKDGMHIAGGVKNGIQYQPNRHFSFSSDLGFGIQGNDTPYSAETIGAQLLLSVVVGYRF